MVNDVLSEENLTGLTAPELDALAFPLRDEDRRVGDKPDIVVHVRAALPAISLRISVERPLALSKTVKDVL